jgi:apolipoprotein N-acyltransferase
MVVLSDGTWHTFNAKAKSAALTGTLLLIAGPFAVSALIENRYEDAMDADEKLETLIIQPNIDPYNKFEHLTQSQQNDILLSQVDSAISGRKTDSTAAPLLIVAPETFTNDITVGRYANSRTWNRFTSYLKDYPNVNLLFGASSYEHIQSALPPSKTARKLGQNSWYESHNSALMIDGNARTEIFHKSKLVVAVEKTPYPGLFCKIDDMLGGVMGRCIGQQEISLLNVRYTAENQKEASIPVGCAVCYESVYGEYYTDYVRKGAEMMAIITNDAWWGNTPGYKQHLSYASLRAIETRRAIARCANTGISAIISPSGDIVEETQWWKPAVLKGVLPLRQDITFFVAHGDITGRVCTFLFLMLLLALIVRFRTL